MVKDHRRTRVGTPTRPDGDLDLFIDAYLRAQLAGVLRVLTARAKRSAEARDDHGSHIVSTSASTRAPREKDAAHLNTARTPSLSGSGRRRRAHRSEIVCGPAMGGIILAHGPGITRPPAVMPRGAATAACAEARHDKPVAGRVLAVEDAQHRRLDWETITAVRRGRRRRPSQPPRSEPRRVTAAQGAPGSSRSTSRSTRGTPTCPLCRDGVLINTDVGAREFRRVALNAATSLASAIAFLAVGD
jgi:hypothetical protein